MYSTGGDSASLMNEVLYCDNTETLKDFMDDIENKYIAREKDKLNKILELSIDYKTKNNIDSFSINQMIFLLEDQIELLKNIKKIFKIIRKTKDYREKYEFSPDDIFYYCMNKKICKFLLIPLVILYSLFNIAKDIIDFF
jgi:hypothetical protein